MEKGSGWYRINGKIVTDISNAIGSSSLEEEFSKSMDIIALQIREIIPSHQSAVSYVPNGDFDKAMHTTSFSDKYAKYRQYDVMPTGKGIWAVIFEEKKNMCLTEEELKVHPRFKHFSGCISSSGLEHPPLPGWLAVPVFSRNHKVIGMLQLSDKNEGDYDEEDIRGLERYATVISHAFEIHFQNETIIENSKQIENLDKLVHLDHLTKINNRLSFDLKIVESFNDRKRLSQNTSLLMIDLDSFKSVNDTLGHSIGDEILLQTTFRIQELTKEKYYIARLGGDEFAVILPSINDSVKLANKLIESFQVPFSIQGHEIINTISIGISDAQSAMNADQLIQNADMALYRAKNEGKNSFNIYEKRLDEKRKRQLLIETSLRNAVNAEEFSLKYQPIFNLNTMRPVFLEALIRWKNDRLGQVNPDEFITIAEQTKKIGEITSWVIKQVMTDLTNWNKQNLSLLPITINISPHDLLTPSMTYLIKELASNSQIPLNHIKLELTETLALANNDVIRNNLIQLSDLGIDVIIDDFGTGYSSLSKLTQLPVDYVKTDKDFMLKFEHEGNRQIIESVNAISKTFDFDVIIEGIETKDHLEFAKHTGAQYGQGFYLCMPESASTIQKQYL